MDSFVFCLVVSFIRQNGQNNVHISIQKKQEKPQPKTIHEILLPSNLGEFQMK